MLPAQETTNTHDISNTMVNGLGRRSAICFANMHLYLTPSLVFWFSTWKQTKQTLCRWFSQDTKLPDVITTAIYNNMIIPKVFQHYYHKLISWTRTFVKRFSWKLTMALAPTGSCFLVKSEIVGALYPQKQEAIRWRIYTNSSFGFYFLFVNSWKNKNSKRIL